MTRPPTVSMQGDRLYLLERDGRDGADGDADLVAGGHARDDRGGEHARHRSLLRGTRYCSKGDSLSLNTYNLVFSFSRGRGVRRVREVRAGHPQPQVEAHPRQPPPKANRLRRPQVHTTF